MNANLQCKQCLFKKNISNAKDFPKEKIEIFEEGISELIKKLGDIKSAPYIQSRIDALYLECFGKKRDFTEIKKKYNLFMLEKEEIIKKAINESEDIISACIRLACSGNYIDFGAVDSVNDKILDKLLDKAMNEKLCENDLLRFKSDLKNAKRLVYLTDNCGEIVLDKIFMEYLKKLYPQLSVTAIVRGGDTLNDATLVDAKMIGLDKIVTTASNGTSIPGTDMEEISEQAKKAILDADVIISKGQGNLETMFGEGLNTYFIFMCKCEMFVDRFGLTQFSSVFKNEKDIVIKG